MALINGHNYSHTNIIVNILGVPIFGIESISYTDDQTIENNYGTNPKPISRGFGAIEYSGTIGLHKEEVEKLIALAPDGRLQQIAEFDIQVSFVPRIDGSGAIINPKTDKLKAVRFKNNGVDSSQGDTKIITDIELIIADIQFGKVKGL